jgi:hypothetical protein
MNNWWGESSTLADAAIQIEELFRSAKMADNIKLADRLFFGCGLGGSRGGKTCAQARLLCPMTVAGQEFLGVRVFDEDVHTRQIRPLAGDTLWGKTLKPRRLSEATHALKRKNSDSPFSNSGAMGYASWRILSSIRGCEGEALGGRRAAQAETWRRAIGRSLRKRGREAGKQKGARSTVCA